MEPTNAAEQHWRQIALYFADVLAASAYDLLEKKSTGKWERRRQLAICTTASQSIKAGYLANKRPPTIPGAIARLENILEKFAQEGGVMNPPKNTYKPFFNAAQVTTDEVEEMQKTIGDLKWDLEKVREELDQLLVQLNMCRMAVLGRQASFAPLLKEGDYGWSGPYQEVLDLRDQYDRMEKLMIERIALEARPIIFEREI